jgi:tRNA nucleotidyltransferase (CCA-adding enzyme)
MKEEPTLPKIRVVVPPHVMSIVKTLRERSFQAFVVGGSLRDFLLKRPVSDWDVSTDAKPDDVIAAFKKTVPVGKAHGTVGVLTTAGLVEVTTFRVEGKYSDSRHPDSVEFIGNVQDDLARRDFTVNAMGYDPISQAFVDPFGGMEDLGRKIIKAVGDPLERFSEDGLRLLRAIRLATVLNFEIERETYEAIASSNRKLAEVSAERVRGELLKCLEAERPSVAFELMRRASLLRYVLPELEEAVGVPQNRYHAYDVYFHSLMTCDAASREKPLVRLAALLHDLGKPATRDVSRGDATFYNHQLVGAEMAGAVLRRLRFSRADREQVVKLVRHHMFNYTGQWTDGALRRFVRKVGEDSLADLFDLRIADRLGNGLKEGFPVYIEDMRTRIESLLSEDHALKVSDLAVDGVDVIRELRLAPGPRVGIVLKKLLEAVLDDPSLNTRERLLKMMRDSDIGGSDFEAGR